MRSDGRAAIEIESSWPGLSGLVPASTFLPSSKTWMSAFAGMTGLCTLPSDEVRKLAPGFKNNRDENILDASCVGWARAATDVVGYSAFAPPCPRGPSAGFDVRPLYPPLKGPEGGGSLAAAERRRAGWGEQKSDPGNQ